MKWEVVGKNIIFTGMLALGAFIGFFIGDIISALFGLKKSGAPDLALTITGSGICGIILVALGLVILFTTDIFDGHQKPTKPPT